MSASGSLRFYNGIRAASPKVRFPLSGAPRLAAMRGVYCEPLFHPESAVEFFNTIRRKPPFGRPSYDAPTHGGFHSDYNPVVPIGASCAFRARCQKNPRRHGEWLKWLLSDPGIGERHQSGAEATTSLKNLRRIPFKFGFTGSRVIHMTSDE